MTLTFAEPSRRHALRRCPLVLLRRRDIDHAERWIATGELVRVRPGVLVDGRGWRALSPWNRYLVRVHAVVLTHPDSVLCLESAASLLGMPVFGDPVVVHTLDGTRGSSRDVGGIRTHTSANDREILVVDGISVVSPVDTAVDLARSRHAAVGLSAADAVLRAGTTVSAEMLVAANESRTSSRGRRQARWVAHRATAAAETPLESISRAAIEWLGFDEPELQHVFRIDGGEDRVDMWWPEHRVIGEADGDVKYDGSLGPSTDAIRREKQRDRRLRSVAAGVGHWGWSDVLEFRPLREELRRAGLPIRQTEDSRALHGLRSIVSRHRS